MKTVQVIVSALFVAATVLPANAVPGHRSTSTPSRNPAHSHSGSNGWLTEVKLCLMGDEIVYGLADFRQSLGQYRLAHSDKEKALLVKRMVVIDHRLAKQMSKFKRMSAGYSAHSDNWKGIYAKTKDDFDNRHGELVVIQTDPVDDIEPSYSYVTGKAPEEQLADIRKELLNSKDSSHQSMELTSLLSYEFKLTEATNALIRVSERDESCMRLKSTLPGLEDAASKTPEVKLVAQPSLSALKAMIPLLDQLDVRDKSSDELENKYVKDYDRQYGVFLNAVTQLIDKVLARIGSR